MFESYTEKARRVIFFARYETSIFGSPAIEPEHLLLGILREDRGLAWRLLPKIPTEQIRDEIAAALPKRESFSTSVDVPLSKESKRVFELAEKEAERLKEPFIAPEHLLLGILSEEKCLAARILARKGLTLESAQKVIPAELQEVRHAMRSVNMVAPSVPRARPRIPALPQIEFRVEGTEYIIGTALGGYIPLVGHEVVTGEGRGRVTQVVHYYEEGLVVGDLEHKKVVVYLHVLKE